MTQAIEDMEGRSIALTPERVPHPTSSIPTDDELRVIQMISKGLTDRAIARRLNVSVITVRRRAGRFRTKVGANSRIQAVAIAAHRGWIEPEACS
jgi:DNA-binding NarL/FixJ family response regulator